MSRREGNVFVIEPEPPSTCELCGKVAKVRPYGPNGERVCFACGMLDEVGTTERFQRLMLGDVDA